MLPLHRWLHQPRRSRRVMSGSRTPPPGRVGRSLHAARCQMMRTSAHRLQSKIACITPMAAWPSTDFSRGPTEPLWRCSSGLPIAPGHRTGRCPQLSRSQRMVYCPRVNSVRTGSAACWMRRAISLFVCDVTIGQTARTPHDRLRGVHLYDPEARSLVGSGPVIEDVNPR